MTALALEIQVQDQLYADLFAFTDASPTYLAYNPLLIGCIKKGKDFISVLSSCNSYTQILGCTGLTISDGVCISDAATGVINYRALLCTDSPLI